MPCEQTILQQWQQQGVLVHFCPELAAGFNVPRPAAEIVGGNGLQVLSGQASVLEISGRDVSARFVQAARKTLDYAREHQVRLAVLTDGSPSCGSTFIYDGGFNGRKLAGSGVTAAWLEQHGIRVFSQEQIEQARDYLQSLD